VREARSGQTQHAGCIDREERRHKTQFFHLTNSVKRRKLRLAGQGTCFVTVSDGGEVSLYARIMDTAASKPMEDL
jgi:hypothetical protein